MTIDDIFTSKCFYKVVYTYIAVQLGIEGANFGLDKFSETKEINNNNLAHLIIRLENQTSGMQDRLSWIEEEIRNCGRVRQSNL